MSNEVLVSFILPVYNSGKFLDECLNSLISQTYQNIEVVAIDDLSTDDSFMILREFRKKDKRIRVYKNKKKYGLAVCLNRGVRRAKGELVTFISPGDINSRHRIKKQLQFLISNPKIVAVGTQSVLIDDKNRKISESSFPQDHENIYKMLPVGLSMKFETVLINKKLLPKDIFKFNAGQYPFIYIDLFMKILKYGEMANLKDYLHRHQENLMNSNSMKKTGKYFAFLKLWLKSITLYDYRPSIKSFISPFPRQA